MKKLLITTILIAGFFISTPVSYAARVAQIAGNDYRVTILCQDTVGDYCTANGIETDVFSFSDNGSFAITSFQGGILNLGATGDYNERGAMRFTASFEVLPEDTTQLGNRYTFDIDGWSFLNIIILGQMDIAIESISLGGFQPTEQTRAYFIGIRQR